MKRDAILTVGRGPSFPSFAESASFADSESLFADEARVCRVRFADCALLLILDLFTCV